MTSQDQETKIPSLRTRQAIRETNLCVIIQKHMDAMLNEICEECEKAIEAELRLRTTDKK